MTYALCVYFGGVLYALPLLVAMTSARAPLAATLMMTVGWPLVLIGSLTGSVQIGAGHNGDDL